LAVVEAVERLHDVVARVALEARREAQLLSLDDDFHARQSGARPKRVQSGVNPAIDRPPPPCYGTASFLAAVSSEIRGSQVIEASVSRRYARALFALAVEQGGYERAGGELDAVAQALRASNEARTLVENPGYTQAQRHALVDLLEKDVPLSPLVARFLRLLVDRHRLAELPAIARSYGEMVDEKMGRLRATV